MLIFITFGRMYYNSAHCMCACNVLLKYVRWLCQQGLIVAGKHDTVSKHAMCMKKISLILGNHTSLFIMGFMMCIYVHNLHSMTIIHSAGN